MCDWTEFVRIGIGRFPTFCRGRDIEAMSFGAAQIDVHRAARAVSRRRFDIRRGEVFVAGPAQRAFRPFRVLFFEILVVPPVHLRLILKRSQRGMDS